MTQSKPESTSIPTINKAFVLQGIEHTEFEVRPIPKTVKENEVIVAPKATGICGSDTHFLVHGGIGDFIVKKPMILGHESAGVVVKVGAAVKHLKEGDRVAMEPGESCQICSSCKEGNYNRCPEMKFAATPPGDGTLQGFYTLPGDLCYKLPDSVSLEEGALMEPLAVAIMAVHSIAKMRPASNVVVFGAGPVGLLICAAARALGARYVLSIDIQEERLKFAKEYAASDYHIPGKPQDGEDKIAYSKRQAAEIRAKFGFDERGPGGVDLVIEATGAAVCIQTGMFLAKHGGTYVQIGMGPVNVEIPITTILIKELTIKGSFRYGAECYPLAIDLVARGLIKLDPLITHRYTFDQCVKAFQANRDGKGADGKPLIKAIISGPL